MGRFIHNIFEDGVDYGQRRIWTLLRKYCTYGRLIANQMVSEFRTCFLLEKDKKQSQKSCECEFENCPLIVKGEVDGNKKI